VEISLTDSGLAVVEGDQDAIDRLITGLAGAPGPAHADPPVQVGDPGGQGRSRPPARSTRSSGGDLLTPRSLEQSILVGVRDHRLRCSVCENAIGFYDPIVVLENSELRPTSLLNEPMLAAEQAVMHHHCAHSADSAPPEC